MRWLLLILVLLITGCTVKESDQLTLTTPQTQSVIMKLTSPTFKEGYILEEAILIGLYKKQ
jgi:uncharacterized lipoprotein YmbA